MLPDIEVNTWWTNLGWTDDDDVIACYHAHGECEQYHSEIKTDMDVERLPSGKFATNCLVLELMIRCNNRPPASCFKGSPTEEHDQPGGAV